MKIVPLKQVRKSVHSIVENKVQRFSLQFVLFSNYLPIMSEEYLQEEAIVYRVFNEIQGYPRKVDQFSEILADVYCHNAEEFVKQFSNCMYTVIGHKGTGKEMENLLSFIATVVSRCIGNEHVPNLSPLIIEVIGMIIFAFVGSLSFYQNKGPLCASTLLKNHKYDFSKVKNIGFGGALIEEAETSVY